MTNIVPIGAAATAEGHPTECTEPAPGSVVSASSASVTITNSSGETKEIATVDTANINFPTHSHTYTDTNGDGTKECTDDQSHTIDPDTTSSSITLNGSPVYIQGSAIGTDPVSGGDVNITDSGINNSVSES